MTIEREKLIDRMIRIYGFENPIVIQFANMCEKAENNEINNKMLTVLVESHEQFPVQGGEE